MNQVENPAILSEDLVGVFGEGQDARVLLRLDYIPSPPDIPQNQVLTLVLDEERVQGLLDHLVVGLRELRRQQRR